MIDVHELQFQTFKSTLEMFITIIKDLHIGPWRSWAFWRNP